MAISFEITEQDRTLIFKIVERFVSYPCADDATIDRGALVMDITATHANGCPMDLARWLAADGFDFNHDVIGIMQHLDRKTGELSSCFLPRHAAEEVNAPIDDPWGDHHGRNE